MGCCFRVFRIVAMWCFPLPIWWCDVKEISQLTSKDIIGLTPPYPRVSRKDPLAQGTICAKDFFDAISERRPHVCCSLSSFAKSRVHFELQVYICVRLFHGFHVPAVLGPTIFTYTCSLPLCVSPQQYFKCSSLFQFVSVRNVL